MSDGLAQTRMQAQSSSVSVVIPCCNEVAGLDQLRERLLYARRKLQPKYTLHFIFVDDGSTDATWERLRDLFGSSPDCTLIRHQHNLGIGAAIMTGIREARTELVCSVDSDCSYDPSDLERLLSLLTAGVDLVTASPYHPLGEVCRVPPWRLWLSKSASFLYRQVLKQRLCTYTSCFRVYRRSAVLKLKLKHKGFLAIAELIGRLDLQDSVILECPARLTARSHGASKMKIARVLAGHLQLLCELLAGRTKQMLNPRAAASSRDFADCEDGA